MVLSFLDDLVKLLLDILLLPPTPGFAAMWSCGKMMLGELAALIFLRLAIAVAIYHKGFDSSRIRLSKKPFPVQNTFARRFLLRSGKHSGIIETDRKAGLTGGVDGTPAVFINGGFLSGAVPLEQIFTVIDDELRRKGVKWRFQIVGEYCVQKRVRFNTTGLILG
jgi:hypothetical protein